MSINPLSHSYESEISAYSNEELNTACLPFVVDVPGKKSFWSVRPNGDYRDECIIGEHYAIDYLQYAVIADMGLLAAIAKDMPKHFTGIETAFWCTLDEFLKRGVKYTIAEQDCK